MLNNPPLEQGDQGDGCVLSTEEENELEFPFEMAWASPQYSRTRVDAAGATLIGPDAASYENLGELDEALTIINNWRSSHSFPLNTFQNTLRHKAKQIDPKTLVAQRIKRLSSIELKLRRFPHMKLSQMQDLGGCRAVVESVSLVRELATVYGGSGLKHKLVNVDDYIRKPKLSGYRGVHLIYSYYSDRKETYNGLKIEMQLRSPLQHAWATAVETVGTFIQQALKASRGEEEWLRFFALMGTALALRERTPPGPDTPIRKGQLKKDLREYVQRLDVEGHLGASCSAWPRCLCRPPRPPPANESGCMFCVASEGARWREWSSGCSAGW